MVIPHHKIHKPTRTLYVAGRKQVGKTMQFLYEDADCYLTRKYDIFRNIYIA